MKDKTTPQWLANQQTLAGVTDEELASALGYESPKVIQMFKSGGMKVPINKVPALADALDLHPGLLMRRVLNDVSPELLQAIEHCLGALCLSEGEQKLIAAIRKANPIKEPVPIMFDRDAIITLIVA
jgi:hypothetical protein